MFHWLVRKSARLLRGNFGRVGGLPLRPGPEQISARCGDLEVPCLYWPSQGGLEPLVLVHGLLASPWIWARLASLLRTGRPIWAPAQRGHGASDTVPSGTTVGKFALDRTSTDLHAFLDAMGLKRVALVGHSWGGKMAIHFAAHHPERVSRLVLADPVLPGGFNRALRRFPQLATAGFAPERRRYADRASMEAAHSQIVYLLTWDEADQAVWNAKFVEQPDGSFVPTVFDAAYREIMDVVLPQDTSHLLPNVACPVLLMRPTFSVSFWPGEMRPFRKALRNRLVEKRISGDHTFVHSNPRDTAEAIEKFLDEAA